MSAIFDVTIQTIDTNVERLPDSIMLALIVGLGLPAGPAGMVHIPVGAVKTFMSAERAVEQGELLQKVGGMSYEDYLAEQKAEEAQQGSGDIVIAKSLQGIDQAAAMNEKFRQGSPPRG